MRHNRIAARNFLQKSEELTDKEFIRDQLPGFAFLALQKLTKQALSGTARRFR
jgi:hypothetical protein